MARPCPLLLLLRNPLALRNSGSRERSWPPRLRSVAMVCVPCDEWAEGGSGRGGTPLWRSSLHKEDDQVAALIIKHHWQCSTQLYHACILHTEGINYTKIPPTLSYRVEYLWFTACVQCGTVQEQELTTVQVYCITLSANQSLPSNSAPSTFAVPHCWTWHHPG